MISNILGKFVIGLLSVALVGLFVLEDGIANDREMEQSRTVPKPTNKLAEKQIDPSSCDLVVTFGSYGGGTDAKTEAKVIEYFNSNKRKIRSHESWVVGMEGDTSYCLKVKAGEADNIVEEIRGMVPAESKKGWTAIRKDGAQIFQTTWPK